MKTVNSERAFPVSSALGGTVSPQYRTQFAVGSHKSPTHYRGCPSGRAFQRAEMGVYCTHR